MFASGADRSVLMNAAVLDGDAERPSDCCCTSSRRQNISPWKHDLRNRRKCRQLVNWPANRARFQEPANGDDRVSRSIVSAVSVGRAAIRGRHSDQAERLPRHVFGSPTPCFLSPTHAETASAEYNGSFGEVVEPLADAPWLSVRAQDGSRPRFWVREGRPQGQLE